MGAGGWANTTQPHLAPANSGGRLGARRPILFALLLGPTGPDPPQSVVPLKLAQEQDDLV